MHMVSGTLQKGFTLVELVIVIVLLSVLGIMTSSYISTGVDIYSDIAERDKSLNSIRFVMERLRREVANALPNSATVSSDGQCLTFTPIIASSIYGDDFPIAPVSASVGTIAPMASDISAAKAVVYLLDADELAATATDKKVWPINDYSAGVSTLNFSTESSFALSSPAKRVYIIRDNTQYCFIGTELKRQADEDDYVLMAEDISGSFDASSATLQRNGLVQVSFELTFDGQEVPIEQTLHIYNTP